MRVAVARTPRFAPSDRPLRATTTRDAGRSASTLVGLAGTVTTVTALALDLPQYDADRIHHAKVSYDAVAKVTADLLAMTPAERMQLPIMHPGRADVIGAGALILRVIMERAGMTSVIASEHDILDGIAYSLSPSVRDLAGKVADRDAEVLRRLAE